MFDFMQKETLMKREGIRDGLALVPSGVFILAALHEGRNQAMLASFVQQAAFDPPMVIAAIQSTRPVRRSMEESRHFALSILGKKSKSALKTVLERPSRGQRSLSRACYGNVRHGNSHRQGGRGLP